MEEIDMGFEIDTEELNKMIFDTSKLISSLEKRIGIKFTENQEENITSSIIHLSIEREIDIIDLTIEDIFSELLSK